MIFLLSEKQENPIKDIYNFVDICSHYNGKTLRPLAYLPHPPTSSFFFFFSPPPPQHDTEKKNGRPGHFPASNFLNAKD